MRGRGGLDLAAPNDSTGGEQTMNDPETIVTLIAIIIPIVVAILKS